MLQSFSGATVRRVIDRSCARVPEHAHDWPVLAIFVIGGYRNRTELGERFIAGPSAILYRAGAAHQNTAAATGFEQIEIEFDPDWVGEALPDTPVSTWLGGRAAAGARKLAQRSGRHIEQEELRTAVQCFIRSASREPEFTAPPWFERVARRLRQDVALRVRELAREANRHPSWLGAAYRRASGEGLLESAARFRVERAARLLRETDRPSASIALDAGFCDQSHMNRTFRRVLGRSPAIVRKERVHFRQIAQELGDGR